MPVDPKDFFKLYVLAPYAAWADDELCQWKALATASGINAFVEQAFRATNPTDPIGTSAYQQKLGGYRQELECVVEHQHILYIVEAYKHVELKISVEGSGQLRHDARAAGWGLLGCLQPWV